jgi:dimethylaniline monooxygenase (N-oxide forming)
MRLVLLSVHGEHRFSALPMPSPEGHTKTGGRLTGYDVRRYLEDFRARFLNGKIRFEMEVLNIRRGDHGQGWSVRVRDTKSASPDTAVQVLHYPRIVLCTGVSFISTLLAAESDP